jgi:phosphatidylglycerophosphate synthase
MADALTLARFALAIGIAWFAVAGDGTFAGAALIAGAVTDVLDGRVARRRGGSLHGARLDAAADLCVLGSTAAAVVRLHPAIPAASSWLIGGTAVIYLASMATEWLVHRRLVDPKQRTGKIAGGLLYLFALFTLLTGVYEALLLDAALLALALSGLETILNATRTIQAKASANSRRSHAPQAANGVVRRTAAAASIATSAAPSTTEMRP